MQVDFGNPLTDTFETYQNHRFKMDVMIFLPCRKHDGHYVFLDLQRCTPE